MARALNEALWRQLTEEIMLGMPEWRNQHSKASLREIETELDARLSRARARLLEDLALASTAATWQEAARLQSPTCPECGSPLDERGSQRRTLLTHAGQELTLERSYRVCPECGSRLFPLDDELGLLPGQLTPRLQEGLVRLSTHVGSFGKAAIEFAFWTQVDVQRTSACPISEAAGASAVAIQTQQAEHILQTHRLPRGSRDQVVLSVEGALVPLRHGQWAEARRLAVGEPSVSMSSEGQQVLQTTAL